MRKLTRALGPVRELEVALAMSESAGRDASQALEGGGKGADRGGERAADRGPDADRRADQGPDRGADQGADRDTRPGRDELQRTLRQDLERARANLTRTLDEDKISRWLEHMRELEDSLGELDAPAEWRRELADRLERRTERLQSALDEAGVLFIAERLHEVRIALKRLRYAMELAGELGLASTTAAVRGLKAVQDILGSLHDLDVLMSHAAAAAGQPDIDRVARASLTALHGALDVDRHMLHAQFLAQRPALLRLHDRALEVAARARTRRAPRTRPARISA